MYFPGYRRPVERRQGVGRRFGLSRVIGRHNKAGTSIIGEVVPHPVDEHVEPVAELAAELRALVLDAMPGAEERVYTGWHGLGYVDPEAGYVCAIFPLVDSVKLLFEHGHLLPDPNGLFTGGTGQTRHIELAPGDSIPVEGIVDLIGDAIDAKASR